MNPRIREARMKEILVQMFMFMFYCVVFFVILERGASIANTPAFLVMMFIIGGSTGIWALGLSMSIIRRND